MTAARTKFATFRAWLPIFILLFCALVMAGIWLVPWGEGGMRAILVMSTQALIFLTVLLLLLWLAFLAPWRWLARLGVLLPILGILGALAYCFPVEERVTGDMGLMFRWRWSPVREFAGTAEGELAGPLTGLEPTDYPEYRGRQRDGIVREGPKLARSWTSPPLEIWRHGIGEGHSGFAIAGPLAFTLEQRGNGEAVVAYDVADGKQRWLYSYPDARFYDRLGDVGPRSTPTVRDGHVYALGATGVLNCLDARTGKLKWTVDTLAGSANDKNPNVKWGLSGSPLVTDGLVIVNPGVQSPQSAPRGTLVAYEAASGKELWSAGTTEAGYSSPMLATLGGKRQVLLFDGEGFAGYDLAGKGRQLWRIDWKTEQNINAAQPIVLADDRVFITSGYGVGCAVVEIKQKDGDWTANILKKNRKLRSRFSSPVYHDGHLYGLDDGMLVCLDAQTLERQWQGKRYNNGQVLLCQGLLLVSVEEDGGIAVVEASPEKAKELGRFNAVPGRLWNPFALANGKLYVRNHREMACFDLTQH